MKTHYTKKRKRYGAEHKLNSALESIVLEVIPDDELMTGEDAYDLAHHRFERDGIEPPSPKGFLYLLEDLSGRGFLVEVHGSRLERLVEAI